MNVEFNNSQNVIFSAAIQLAAAEIAAGKLKVGPHPRIQSKDDAARFVSMAIAIREAVEIGTDDSAEPVATTAPVTKKKKRRSPRITKLEI